MKIQVLQENLNKALNTALRSVSTRAQLPVLSNFLLKTENGQLKVIATNLETAVCITVGSKVEKEGEITVPAKVLAEIVSGLSTGKVNLSVNITALLLSTDYYQATINGIPSTEFPTLPEYEESNFFSLPLELLDKVIGQTAFAAATDEGRPTLTGVLIVMEGKRLSVVATDGYRLSIKTVELDEKIGGEFKLLVPAKTIFEVQRIIGEYKGESNNIKFGYTKDKNQIVFILDGMTLFSRLIEGEFPDYQRIIPKEQTTKLTFDSVELNRAVKLASVFSRDSANIVKFKAEEGKLIISANSPQVGENKVEIEVKHEGEPIEIAFNYRFVQSLLGSVEEGEIVFEAKDALSPGAFKLTADKDFLHVIMPVRLQTEVT